MTMVLKTIQTTMLEGNEQAYKSKSYKERRTILIFLLNMKLRTRVMMKATSPANISPIPLLKQRNIITYLMETFLSTWKNAPHKRIVFSKSALVLALKDSAWAHLSFN
jgi:hypothetical protein